MIFSNQKHALDQVISGLLHNRFIRNLGYMGMAQIIHRVFRLAATIVVARMLFPEDYGIAALALSVNEILHVLIKGAVVNKLVQCQDRELAQLARSAYWLNWMLCIALMLVQCVAAAGFAWGHENPQLGVAIAALSLTYLVLPFGTIQAALTIRENRMAVTARSESWQTVIDCSLTIAMALLGFGLWSLVAPKIVAAPMWAWIYRRASDWRITGRPRLAGASRLLSFGRQIIASDVIQTLRNNIDYLLVSYFLGIEALGIYFFAYNAGLGISQGFINAYTATLYPYLCESGNAAERVRRYTRTLKISACVAVTIIGLQSLLAPLYVPIIFGEKWIEAGALPVIILICLSAMSRPLAEAATQYLRSCGLLKIDLLWQLLFTLVLGLALLIGVRWGLTGVAAAILLVHLLLQPLFSLWVIRLPISKNHPVNWRNLSCQKV